MQYSDQPVHQNNLSTIELQWLEHHLNHEKSSRREFELVSVNLSARSGGIIEISFRFS